MQAGRCNSINRLSLPQTDRRAVLLVGTVASGFERADEIAEEHERTVDTAVAFGHPARNIVDRAEEYDTVVVGAHGADWSRASRQFLIGNIAETVSRRAPVPVVIVR